ncbi:hypothetical protein GCM10017771_09300 [Streptomyces capitiformicae]|uniref:Uncharacterized protein n=1 Tax=Streptomyces capitiformicae TaxID=2014920 RepID=A0A919GE27_9ACTN|nr:hypothetical protein GCM10017771_09300 [Streptomyces capitiformicae]
MRSGSGKAASGSYTRRYDAYGTITEDTLGTPAPSPGSYRGNLRNPHMSGPENCTDRTTAVLQEWVILKLRRCRAGAGSSLMLTDPATRTGACIQPPLLTQESPQ